MKKHNLNFLNTVKEFYQHYNMLMSQGYKNKDIAKWLKLYPSAFSALVNKIIIPLHSLTGEETDIDKKVSSLFIQVNNVSEMKTRQRLNGYVEQLKQLTTQVEAKKPGEPLQRFFNGLSRQSPKEVLKMLEGIYHCYYLSTFGYKIKREPLMVTIDPTTDTCIVKKGNDQSYARYEGLGYISNNHLFTIQINEKDTLIADHFIAHFHLPPSYSKTMNLLKGISVSMSNGYLPISRKIILHRYSSTTEIKLYERQKTVFFEKSASKENAIIKYLLREKNLIEYLPVPRPVYDLDDLQTEEKVMKIDQ